jgi:hypothetical protein
MMGGLARVEFVEGRPFFMTFFLNNKVVVHPTSHVGAEADEFIKKHVGTLLTPPFDTDRSIGTMVAHDIEVKSAIIFFPFLCSLLMFQCNA